MKIDEELLERLATLARIRIDEDEREGLINDLQKMFDMASIVCDLELEEADTSTDFPGKEGFTREDIPGPVLSSEDALGNAAHHDTYFFKVPKVINKKG